MPIEKGKEWGSEGALPNGAPAAASDADLARLIADGATHVRPTGGDLARTLGVSEASLRRDAAMLLPIDALAVALDGQRHRVVANLVVGSRRRPKAVIANAAFLGQWNIAPRAHPGDGRCDVVVFDLAFVDWLKAQRRLPTGSHVPHPDISVRSLRAWEQTYDRPQAITLDGVGGFRARRVEVHVEPDAFVAGV